MLAYAGFFFLVFVSAVSIFLQVQNQELSRAEHAYAQEIAYGFADNVYTAFVAGPGFVETVAVPRDILGKHYWLWISKSPDASARETGMVYVEWQSEGKNESFSAPTVTASYSWVNSNMVSAPGNFILIDPAKGGSLNISNEAGTIKIVKG